MYVTELDSFVQKFHQLWKAGVTAHLDLDTHAGNAWVGLRVQLGHVPGPVQHSSHHHRRGPAYQRRQLRRQAERAAAKTSSSDALPAAQVSDTSKETGHDDLNEKSKENDVSKSAEEASYHCDICDFESNWANGLSIHMARKHPNIAQLDGSDSLSDDLDEEDSYVKTIHYWKRGKLGSIYQHFLDVMDVIETSDLTEKAKDAEKAKVLESRKIAFGKDFGDFPPWSSK